MKKSPHVSIIVTFYNLENCIDYCLSSVLAQDYTDYEVICVDDGSKDSTFEKLLQFSDKHNVRVLRQVNSGPSAARNLGLKHAEGELISFIDGDDIISPFYLSTLIKAVEENQADVATGVISFISEKDIGHAHEAWTKPQAVEVFDRKRAIEKVLCLKLGISGCAKLVPKKLYNDEAFPVGRFHEDLYSIVDLYKQTQRIALVKEPIYKYIQRPGSNMHGFVGHEQWLEDYTFAIDHLTASSQEIGIDPAYIEFYRCLACIQFYNIGGKSIDYKKIRNYVRHNYKKALSCKEASRENRIAIALFSLGKLPYNLTKKLRSTLSFRK